MVDVNGPPVPDATGQFVGLRAVHETVQAQMAVKLFTVLGVTKHGRTLTRLYSSHPEQYPVGGTKDIAGVVSPDWLETCLTGQQPFFGPSVVDVERVLADSALIAKLGCGSIINVPVIHHARTIGVLNILGAEGAYTEADVAKAVGLAARSASAVAAAVAELATERP